MWCIVYRHFMKNDVLFYLYSAQNIELIVVGSHGRHGFSLIFGSTSNSVLHGAQCDVLAVRIDA